MFLSLLDCNEDTKIPDVKKSAAAMEKNLIHLSCLIVSGMLLNYWVKKIEVRSIHEHLQKKQEQKAEQKKAAKKENRNGILPFLFSFYNFLDERRKLI